MRVSGLWTRRRLLSGALALGSVGAGWAKDGPQRCSLELKNLHTGEVLKVTWDRGAAPGAQDLPRLQHLLRDYRVDEEHAMDPALYGLLCDLAQAAGLPARYEVISGYRSPRTNQKLHDAGHQVAEHSQHMEGRALDVRLVGCELARLRDLALQAKRGGVGYYPGSNFVHVDTGRVRSWNGR